MEDGEFCGYPLAPNGSGKSTLCGQFTALVIAMTARSCGTIGTPIEISRRDFARKVAVVSQFNSVVPLTSPRSRDCSRWDAVHQSAPSKETDHDESIVSDVIQKAVPSRFEDRSLPRLGGRNNGHVGFRALAQEPEFLVLDEPINHPGYYVPDIDILRLVRNLGISRLAVLHDIVMAAIMSIACIFKEGTIVSEGTPEIL